jgi:hypothetical protein
MHGRDLAAVGKPLGGDSDARAREISRVSFAGGRRRVQRAGEGVAGSARGARARERITGGNGDDDAHVRAAAGAGRLGLGDKPRRTVMTGGTNASVRCQMNRRLRKTSVGRIVGATKLLGETHHRMVRRPGNITRWSSCTRV